MTYYPVNLDIHGKQCLVIGGGKVGLRKILSLIGCDARVTVISPEVIPEIQTLVEQDALLWRQREYQSGDLEGVFLAFAATDQAAVQAKISRDAKECSVLLNSVDDPARCDFQVPAKIRRGDLLITVSTGGASPALSKSIRKQLGEQFGSEYATVVDLLASVRELVVSGSADSVENRKMFRELIMSDMLTHARRGEWGSVERILEIVLPNDIDTAQLIKDVVDKNRSNKVNES